MRAVAAYDIDTEILNKLEQHGFSVMKSCASVGVLPALCYHPDMQIAVVGKCAVCAPSVYEYYRDFITSAGYSCIEGKTTLSSNYPRDIAYNISVVSDFLFHNLKHTDSEILRLGQKMKLVHVPQGYTGCSTCRIGGGAVITADVPIFNAAKANGLEALLISSGNIKLDGFDTGFIGGASFFCRGVLYLFGSLKSHPDGEKIRKFCQTHNTEICELSDGELTDYGSVITFD